VFPLHAPDSQSLSIAQRRPVTHFGHIPPPQSMSVSAPFLMPSEHAGAWQMSDLHTLLLQSVEAKHF
jgi:hypothetical protein